MSAAKKEKKKAEPQKPSSNEQKGIDRRAAARAVRLEAKKK